MKTASGALIALLNSNVSFKVADLLLFTNIGAGDTLAMCSADFAINDGSNNYLPKSTTGLQFKRTATKSMIGLQVDQMDITLQGVYTYGGIPLQQAVANGAFDGAYVTLQRAFMPEWGDTTPGFLWQFSGRISDVEVSRNEIRLRVKSDLELLDVQFPQNLFQPGCTNTLFDVRCGAVKATYTTNTSVAAGASTTSLIKVTNANITDYFNLGTVLFTSGQNTGAKRTIKKFTAGTPADIQLMLPLPYVPGVGDTFQLVPGCDKTKTGVNGCTKFANTGRYRGCRFIPRPETAR